MTVISPSRAFIPSTTPNANPEPHTKPAPTTSQAAQSNSANPMPTPDNPAALQLAFGDRCDWQALLKHLQPIIQTLNGDPRSADVVLATRLKSTLMSVCEDSSYSREHGLAPNERVSLDAFIQGKGLSVPTTPAELASLNQRVLLQAQAHPLGNFSGALSWPVPPSPQDQRSIVTLLQGTTAQLPGLPLADERKGTLGYLLSGSSVSESDLKKPTVAIEKLLGSAKAQALGQAIQTQLGGYATNSSLNEYLLAAIHLGLDPESLEAPAPSSVAGFDLAREAHRGQGAQTVIDNLAQHLLDKGRVTAQTASLGARLLLAKAAPEFLVKSIPRSVTYGSLTWAQLAIATARIEADTPGRSISMNYAEVLAYAAELNTGNAVLQGIHYKAMADWAVANDLLTHATPTDTELETVRVEYNRQMLALTTASSQAKTPIPSRREMALDALKAAFPGVDPALFEVEGMIGVFRIPGRTGKVDGPRSMLDIVMHGKKLGKHEHWESADKRFPAAAFCALRESGKLEVAESFESEYDQAITAAKKGHQGLTQALLATLPPQDRKNLEYGELEFFHTNEYKMGFGMVIAPSETLKRRGHTLRVKTTLGGEVNIYEIDTKAGTVEKQNFLIRRYTPPYTDKKLREEHGDIIHKTVQFKPFKDEQPDLAKAQPRAGDKLPAFGSARSEYIGRVFAESLDLRNQDLSDRARGVTSFDKEAASLKAAGEFFLNLIPLRSAIVNFSNGDIGAGLFDLGLDFVGLVTLGAGKAAQAGKAFSKGISSVRGGAKAMRFVGATVIEVFNPLSGAGDLAQSVGRLINKGASRLISKSIDGVNRLRGASGSYDLLKAASQQHGAAAIGTFKVAGEAVDGAAVLHKGQWYALDVEKLRPYGSPLDAFEPSTRAMNGMILASSLDNGLYTTFKVPESTIDGLSRNSQGIYVAADGHRSHIRHTDSNGLSAVYEVRQVTRTAEGAVQARIYHNNRQTPLLVEHVQGDQWQRLGAQGGGLTSIKSDLGPVIAGGGESTIYASLDGKSIYKDLGPTLRTTAEGATDMEVVNLNKYYGEGFATMAVDEGRMYIKMGRIDGVDLSQIEKGSLPPSARSLLANAFAELEAKDIFHNDAQLKNFMYSAKDNKIYPVDMDGLPGEFMVPFVKDEYEWRKANSLQAFNKLLAKAD